MELIKQRYRQSFRSVLFTDRVNEKDLIFMNKYCIDNSECMSPAEITKNLIRTYFGGRSIFYFSVFAQIIKIQNKQSYQNQQKQVIDVKIRKNQLSNEQFQQYRQLYQISLHQMTNTDHSEQTNEQLFSTINTLCKQESRAFWQLATQIHKNTNTLATAFQLKLDFKNKFQKQFFTEHLNDNDKDLIYEKCKSTPRNTVYIKKLVEELQETHFKEKILYQEIYRCIQNRISRHATIENFPIEIKKEINNKKYQLEQEEVQHCNVLYVQALKQVHYKDYSDQNPSDLCKIIDNLQTINKIFTFKDISLLTMSIKNQINK
ncbi:Hypothetical_protein [Hexamita inflata]|uniref:Hypothetical_protein n=1 Tax=Hexamita inflata TaxID=28002 RepID=A0AA86UI60_9EUKA|nr:Hypothetical protein HINF_LOCUS705 [Hexamita inflata]CAI9956739.1 Hypothetical protein HINF_LOCUS44384 [Hexamita inflata]